MTAASGSLAPGEVPVAPPPSGTPPRRRGPAGRLGRAIMWVALGLVGLVAVLLAGAWATLQSGWGRGQVLALVKEATATLPVRIEAGGLSGNLPFDGRLSDIRIYDAQGLLATVEAVDIDLSLGRLLGRHLTVNDLTVTRPVLLRPPVLAEQPPSPPDDDQPPSLPISITLARLLIQEARLEPPVAGQAISFDVKGAGAADRALADVTAALAVDLDGKSAARLDATLDLPAERFTADLGVEPAATGLGLAIAQMPAELAGALTARAAGMFTAPEGELRYQAPAANVAVKVQAAADQTLTIDGSVTPGAPEALKPVLTAFGAPEGFTLGEGQASLKGTARLGEETAGRPTSFDLTLNAATSAIALAATPAPGADPASVPANQPLHTGRLQLDATARGQTGPGGRVEGRAAFIAEGLRAAMPGAPATVTAPAAGAADVALDRVELTAEGGGTTGPGGVLTGLVRVGAHGLTVTRAATDVAPASSLTLATATLGGQGTLTLPPAEGAGSHVQGQLEGTAEQMSLAQEGALGLDLDRLALRFDGKTEGTQGQGTQGQGTLTLTAERGQVSVPDAQPSKVGQVVLTVAGVAGLGERPSIDARVDLRTEGLQAQSGAAQDPWVGPVATLSTRLVAAQEPSGARQAKLEALTIETKAVRVVVDAEALTQSDGAFQAKLALQGGAKPDAALPVAPQVKRLLRGGITFDSEVAGTAAGDLALNQIHAKAPGLALDGQLSYATLAATGQVTLQLDDLAAFGIKGGGRLKAELGLAGTRDIPSLTLKHDGIVGGIATAGDLTLGLDQAQQIATADIRRLVYGGANAKGAVRVQLAADPLPLATGTLTVNVDRLERFRPLGLPPDMSGRATLKAELTAANNVQGFTVDADIRDLTQGKARLQRGALRLRGTTQRAEITLDANGSFDSRPLTAALTSTLAMAGEGAQRAIQVGLSRLRLTASGETLTLVRPASVGVVGDTVTVRDLAIDRTGGGRLLADGTAGTSLNMRLEAQRIPLSVARLAGVEVDGVLGADIRLTGSASAPEGELRVQVDDFRNPTLTNVYKPLDAVVEATLRGGRLNGRATVTGQAQDRMSVVANLAPFGVGVDPARLGGTVEVDGRIDLAPLGGLMEGGTRQVAGVLVVDLTASLRPGEAPALSGGARMSNGQFVDQVFGVRLTGINAALLADRATPRLEFSARAPNGGTLQGAGTVTLPTPEAGLGLDATLTMRGAQLVQRDEATVVVSGDVRVQQAPTRPMRISGTIRFDEAEIRIPERLPGSIPQVEVVEVNVPAGIPRYERTRQQRELEAERRRREETAAANGTAALPAELDLVVDAPQAIYVRGRGLDAEFYGRVFVRGTVARPSLDGGFKLRKGEMDFLGQNLEFSRGEIVFQGTRLDPRLDIAADTTVESAVLTIAVTGRASDPQIDFTSSPSLPQEEILSRLLFGKVRGDISALEAIQLAQAVRTLTGAGGGGGFDLLTNLREDLGLDELSVGSSGSDPGATAVQAGRYLGSGFYIGIEQGMGESGTAANLRYEIIDNIEARAETGSTGDTKVGIKGEWDY